MRARAHIEELRGGKSAIIVTELPYGVKKGGDTGVIKKIADLVQREGDDRGLRSRRPQRPHRHADPDRAEARRGAAGRARTSSSSTRRSRAPSATTPSRCRGVPRTLSLLELVTHYLEFQRELVTRRSQYQLRHAERRAHILQGYLTALDNLDAVIAVIRGSSDTEEARQGLMSQFGLSELQTNAILELQLRRLTGLARKEVRTNSPSYRGGSASCATCSPTRPRSMR